MASGCPTLLYYPRYFWETRPEFDNLLKILAEAKIFHENVSSITKHLKEIHTNPYVWWESSFVCKVRSDFHKMACILDPNKIEKWAQFINSFVDKNFTALIREIKNRTKSFRKKSSVFFNPISPNVER